MGQLFAEITLVDYICIVNGNIDLTAKHFYTNISTKNNQIIYGRKRQKLHNDRRHQRRT